MKDYNGFEDDALNESKEEPSIKEVADLVLQTLEEGYKTEGEPFEVYAQKLKSHIHTDPEVFKHRFKEGYELMVEILNKPNHSVDEK